MLLLGRREGGRGHVKGVTYSRCCPCPAGLSMLPGPPHLPSLLPTPLQINWFKHGSALNAMGATRKAAQ